MKRSKAYLKAAEQIDLDELYSPLAAVRIAKGTVSTKFDPSIEISMRLGVDPRKADQMVRGTVNLPHGTGKTARVLVFANGEKADEARAAGADFVGSDDLIEKVKGGWTDFDSAVSTPDLMGKVGTLGKVLGPKGLMPSPKAGTVSASPADAVKEFQAPCVLMKASDFVKQEALRPHEELRDKNLLLFVDTMAMLSDSVSDKCTVFFSHRDDRRVRT